MAFTKEEEKRLNDVHAQIQKNINSRLDGFRFREVDASTFDGDAGKHDDKQISFVQRDENTIEMYMGDTKIGSSGSGGSKKAVMFANLSWGWDYKGSSEYTQTTTQYGTTQKSTIKPRKVDTSAVDNFEIVPILGFNPVYKPDGEHYETRYFNAIWLKNNVSLTPGYDLELPYDSGDTEYTLKPWHRCAYDTIGLYRWSNLSSQSNLITWTLMPGIVIPGTPIGLYGDTNQQPYDLRGLDYFYNVGFYQFTYKPIILVQEYTESNGAYSRIRSRWYDMCFHSSGKAFNDGAQMPDFKTVKQHNSTPSDSKFRYMNYTRTANSNSQNANYHKECGVCGLCLVLYKDSLKDGITYQPDFPEGFKYYPAAGFKFGIGVLYEDTTESITYNGSGNFTLWYKNNAKKTKLRLLSESSDLNSRLGIKYATNSGNVTSYCLPAPYHYVGDVQYPATAESQRYLESLYILGQGRAANES